MVIGDVAVLLPESVRPTMEPVCRRIAELPARLAAITSLNNIPDVLQREVAQHLKGVKRERDHLDKCRDEVERIRHKQRNRSRRVDEEEKRLGDAWHKLQNMQQQFAGYMWQTHSSAPQSYAASTDLTKISQLERETHILRQQLAKEQNDKQQLQRSVVARDTELLAERRKAEDLYGHIGQLQQKHADVLRNLHSEHRQALIKQQGEHADERAKLQRKLDILQPRLA